MSIADEIRQASLDWGWTPRPAIISPQFLETLMARYGELPAFQAFRPEWVAKVERDAARRCGELTGVLRQSLWP